ncbi:ankyrin repeat domain-containing protein [uncultured Hydrogenophaga sp.]|uniref:ankyrin repeat domain-containing protein n=1 Tax=uncultured Hydrogenophaga sp. TaxID=199683 RepID=UPI00265F627F|nr:ankyrin repeat domain-containing protein [uncultured Hydrogenophaga sp.]
MTWALQQAIKAAGWPLAPELLAPGADFLAPLDGGLVPLHWACAGGKHGLVRHMLEQGADPRVAALDGRTPLELALQAGSFQVVMLLIDRLKALAAPTPDAALRQRLTAAFAGSHTDARNRLQQTLKDWDRIGKKNPVKAQTGPSSRSR